MFSVGIPQQQMAFPNDRFAMQNVQRQNGRRNYGPVNVQNNCMWNSERMRVSKFDRNMDYNDQYYK